jgi:oxygen-independent coproporphyrinogen III oxidase
MSGPLGVYIHFPFCASKCPYCHFASVPYRDDLSAIWTEGIRREIRLRGPGRPVVDTLYIGGGTPSLLRPAGLGGLQSALGDSFDLRLDEFTLEANPGPAGERDLAGWRECGVNRLSVGVQSFDDRILKLLDRRYTARQARIFLDQARKAGFSNISVDLMIGVPTETKDSLEDSLRMTLDFGPEHVSVYILENIEGLPFASVVRDHPPDEDAAADAYDLARGRLEAAGLRRYEISNFARPGKECLHNLKYWRYEPFLGFGPSAASHLPHERWTNKSGIGEWASSLAAGTDPRDEIKLLTPRESLREALIFGLRLARGVSLEDLQQRFGFDAAAIYCQEITELKAEGFLILEADILRIAQDKFLISNRVFSKLV